MASAIFFRASMAARSVESISAASHSKASVGKSRRRRPTERSFHSPFSRTRPILTRTALLPTVSVASRTSTGRKARLSAVSAPPICSSAAPPGVWQCTMGRPEGLGSSEGLPGSLRSTKRFIKATRAEGVRCAKVSALRAVRNFAKACSLCEQAAEMASRRAAVGEPGALAVAELALPAVGRELDSCARMHCAGKNASRVSKRNRLGEIFCTGSTSILGGAEDGGEILREAGAREDVVATGGAGLGGEVGLHMGKESHDANAVLFFTQLLDGLQGLAAGVQVDDDQPGHGLQQGEERVVGGGDFQLHAEVLGGLRHFHLEEQVVHERHNSSHWFCASRFSRLHYAPVPLSMPGCGATMGKVPVANALIEETLFALETLLRHGQKDLSSRP